MVIRPNFVPEFIISNLLELTTQETSPAEVNSAGGQKITDYRSTKWIPLPLEAIKNLQQTVFNIHETEFKPIFKTEATNIEPTQFLKYDIKDKYDEHNDSEDWKSINTRVSDECTNCITNCTVHILSRSSSSTK